MLVMVAVISSIATHYQYFDVEKSINTKVGKIEYANLGTLNGIRYITKNDTVVLSLKGTDANYLSNSLTKEAIVVKVGGNIVTPTTKELSSPTNITNGVQYKLTLSGISGNGELSIEIAENTLKDKSNKQNILTTFKSGIIVDNIGPTCEITTDISGEITNSNNITYTFTFNENVKEFTIEDIIVGSGTKGEFTKVNDKEYKLVVTNNISCTQTVTLLASRCSDIAGNGNLAVTKSLTIDRDIPTAQLYIDGGSYLTPTKGSTAVIKSVVSCNDVGGSRLKSLSYSWSKNNTIKPTSWTNYSVNETLKSIVFEDCEITTYYLWIKAEDNAGNITEVCSKAFTPATLTYSAYVNTRGWSNNSGTGEANMAGTTGQALPINSMKIDSKNNVLEGKIKYAAFIESEAWKTEVFEPSQSCGTNLKMEAFKVYLADDYERYYDIYYKAHVAKVGWLAWAKNGEYAGTIEQNRGIEAIKIQIVRKGEAAPTEDSEVSKAFYAEAQIHYELFVTSKGWMGNNSDMAGTVGQSLRTESLRMSLITEIPGSVSYKVHQQTNGWLSWVGSPNQSCSGGLRLEGLAIKLTGEISKFYNVYYKSHVSSMGWLGWTSNGAYSGTKGYAYMLQAVKIRVVSNARSAPAEDVSKAAYYEYVATPPAHTSHTWDAIGSRVQSVGYSWSCQCGRTHSTAYYIYCHTCGTRKTTSPRLVCPLYPDRGQFPYTVSD